MAREPEKPRSSKLSRDIIMDVCEVVMRGNFRKTAFALVGIPHHTWKHWMLVGKACIAGRPTPGNSNPSQEHKDLCVELVQRLDHVEALVEDEALNDVRTAAKQDWKAASWYLERRHNKKYSRNPAAHWDDEEAVEVKIDAKAVLRDKLDRLTKRLQDKGVIDKEDGDE
jgi:hypothetical protein